MRHVIYRLKKNRFSDVFFSAVVFFGAVALTAFIAGLSVPHPATTLFGLTAIALLVCGCVLVARVNRWNTPRARVVGRKMFGVQTWPFRGKLDRLDHGIEEARLHTRGLMMKNVIQSPAVISLDETALQLWPVAGKPVRVPLEEIRSVTESANFNGAWNPGQTSFTLGVPGYLRLGFAIYDDPAPWREALCGGDLAAVSGADQRA